MAEAEGRSADIITPASLAFPTSLVSPAYGHRPTERPRPTRNRATPQGGWETDGMSYEELVQLEDVKVTATKSAICSMETTILSEPCSADE